MAITGYEIDQVTHSDPIVNSTTVGDVLGGFSCYPDCSTSDKSVPIYNAYNHHYFSWLNGANSEVYDLNKPSGLPNPTKTAFRLKEALRSGVDDAYPNNIVFKENPGGEYRKSYHGYPSGYAQLIANPTQWIVEPMQIDTHNRNYGINEEVGYKPWFLPKQVQNNITDLNSDLSPLIECPCTDRITKKIVNSSAILISGTCEVPIQSLNDCTTAASNYVNISKSIQYDLGEIPPGCLTYPDQNASTYMAVFNEMAGSKKDCDWGGMNQSIMTGEAIFSVGTFISIHHDGQNVNISLSGPDGAWFAVGFDAEVMSDMPYAIIIDGNGNVAERKLVEHGPGSVLTPTITILSSTVIDGVRTVKLIRPLKVAQSLTYSFPSTPGSINLITAVGNGVDFAYHKARTAGVITLLPAEGPMCICQPTQTGYLVYMGTNLQGYPQHICDDEPRSDMLRKGDGTGRALPNNACNVMTYNGGLHCCQNQYLGTDKAQEPMIVNQTDVYFLKWRYYFQEYVPPQPPSTPASHKHLHHWVFLIDSSVNDYEEDNVESLYGTDSIGKITAHLTGRDLGLEDVPSSYSKIIPHVMTPHCHAPSCIREELWNADTNQILCNVSVMYGGGYGLSGQIFNEANYVAIPPCIFGDQAGLQTPWEISPTTNIYAVKYFNNTYRHLGQMAQWTGLMVYDTDPY